jgi:hypothetical protein
MTSQPYTLEFIERLIRMLQEQLAWTEQTGPDAGPYLPLTLSESPETSAGYVRLWAAAGNNSLDRMVHMRLISGPVETQLLFVFGRSDSTMPHLHAQAVQFPPNGCVYNVDLLPRLDAVDYPDWFERVFSGLRRPYRQATSDASNSCAQAPANPALAVFMSPWGLASARTDRAELDKLAPQIDAYVDHYVRLALEDGWEAPAGLDLRARDQRHLALFFDDDLDPRAWNGVYKVIGEARGKVIKSLLQTPQIS